MLEAVPRPLFLNKALEIQGWMDPHDLEWLAAKATTHTRICEVGCWLGRSTRVLADNTAGRVFAVDHWLGSEEHQANDAKLEWVYPQFRRNLQDHIDSGKVWVVKFPSVEAAKILGHMTFDMVFIDASHDFDSVSADILAWKPLVEKGGLFCGHDGGHPPIMQALKQLLPEWRFENSMWVVEC